MLLFYDLIHQGIMPLFFFLSAIYAYSYVSLAVAFFLSQSHTSFCNIGTLYTTLHEVIIIGNIVLFEGLVVFICYQNLWLQIYSPQLETPPPRWVHFAHGMLLFLYQVGFHFYMFFFVSLICYLLFMGLGEVGGEM